MVTWSQPYLEKVTWALKWRVDWMGQEFIQEEQKGAALTGCQATDSCWT